MRFTRTDRFKRDFHSLPAELQRRAEESLRTLATNPHHPSLRVKRIQGHPRIWEARVIRSYRLTFEWAGEELVLRRVGTHDILRTP
jgi:mRNA-degrading endonuclease RelE of RelBE toxin-antitoxin system